MPIYEYECQSCAKRVEVMQNFSDPPLETCESCGGELRKLISAPAFRFKGSGWYVTDYARKGKEGAGKKEDATKGDANKSSSSPDSSGAGDTPSPSAPSQETGLTKAERAQSG